MLESQPVPVVPVPLSAAQQKRGLRWLHRLFLQSQGLGAPPTARNAALALPQREIAAQEPPPSVRSVGILQRPTEHGR